jgi:hypothetical protein
MFPEYRRKYGDMPAPDIEPTAEQISAVHQLMASEAPPYVDFSIFGPHGHRTLRKLSHTALQYNPLDGSWKHKEQDGPASFDTWWKSWRVFKTTMLLLDAALPSAWTVTPNTSDTSSPLTAPPSGGSSIAPTYACGTNT